MDLEINMGALGYIEIPHQGKPGWVYPDYPDTFPPGEEDHFYKGDHGNYLTIEVVDLEDLESIAYTYDGHRWVSVRTLAKEMLEEFGC